MRTIGFESTTRNAPSELFLTPFPFIFSLYHILFLFTENAEAETHNS